MSISKLVAVGARPTATLASVFRVLGTRLGDNFVALYGASEEAGNSTALELLDGYSAKVVRMRGPFDIGRQLRRAGVGRHCSVIFTDIESSFAATALLAAKALRARLLLRFSPETSPASAVQSRWTNRLWDRVSLSIFDCFLVGGSVDWRELEAEVRDPLIVFSPPPADGSDYTDLVANYSVVRRETREQIDANVTDFLLAVSRATEPLVKAAHSLQQHSPVRLLVTGQPPKGTLAMMIESLSWKLPPIVAASHDLQLAAEPLALTAEPLASTTAAYLCAADGYAHFRGAEADGEPAKDATARWPQEICDAQRLGNVCLVDQSIRAAKDLIVDGKNGLIVDDSSTNQLIAALTRLVAIRDRTEHIDVNKKVLEMFTAENCAEGFLAAAKLGSTGALLLRPPGLRSPEAALFSAQVSTKLGIEEP